jgi:hypothetical protein
MNARVSEYRLNPPPPRGGDYRYRFRKGKEFLGLGQNIYPCACSYIGTYWDFWYRQQPVIIF